MIDEDVSLKLPNSEENERCSEEHIPEHRKKFLKKDPDEAYENFTIICKKCGKKFIKRLKIRHFKMNYRIPQFCCREHANSHIRTKESKIKTSLSTSKPRKHICPECGKEFIHVGCSTHKTLCDKCYLKKWGYSRKDRKNSKQKTSPRPYMSKCSSCGKTIWIKTLNKAYCYECCDRLNKHHYQLYTKSGKRIISEKTRQRLRDAQQQRVLTGTHKGWISRNITSYPEKFWTRVLDNNGISFNRETPVFGYFLDFLIKKNGKLINLEIDGKQHTYSDRIQNDRKRDRILRENGYIIYRIAWNNINNNVGKKRMKFKIKQFLWWFDHQ